MNCPARLVTTLVCVAMAVTLVRQAGAQILYGSVIGTVKDTSDSAVAGSKITIVNQQTGETRETSSNVDGGYSFPTLQSGSWELRISKDGFRTATNKVDVTINGVV